MLFTVPTRMLAIAAIISIIHGADGRAAQLQHGSLAVLVLDVRQAPVADAEVVLSDPLGAVIQSARTDAAGRASFVGVTPGRYALRAGPESAALPRVPVQVVDALPVEVTLRMPVGISDHVVVEAGSLDEPSTRGSLAGATLARVPLRTRARGLQDAVTTLPGWSTEDNGLMHARGVDDGFLYVIDGVPVYERLDAISGITPDLLSVGCYEIVLADQRACDVTDRSGGRDVHTLGTSADDLLEDRLVITYVVEHERRDGVIAHAIRRRSARDDAHQPFGRFDRQGAEEQGIDEPRQGQRAANRQSQGEQRYGTRRGCTPPLPHRHDDVVAHAAD
jgi:hypothetical protein